MYDVVVSNKCENVNSDRLGISFLRLASPVINVLIMVKKYWLQFLRVAFYWLPVLRKERWFSDLERYVK